MAEIKTLCYVCGKVASHVCRMCGRHVCGDHYDVGSGLCHSCARGRTQALK